ncbi:tetraspanin family protein, partial [Glycocaulis profundi]
GLAIGFIVLGFAVAIIALIGLFALFCKNRFLGFIYIALLAILSIIELVIIIYFFAIPENLNKAAYKVLNSSFQHLQTNDSLTNASYTLWVVLGSDGDEFCCGLGGYSDFGVLISGLPYPPPCCKQNITASSTTQQPPKCDQNEAKT